MKIQITLQNFDYLSGSPLYNFEIAKELVKLGNEVNIFSPSVGGVIAEKALENGVNFSIFENADLWISNQNLLININAKKHFHIFHSEFNCENANVAAEKYFVVRPLSLKKYPFAEILWNPIDVERFNEKNTTNENFILFVGTVDLMRKQAFLETCRIAKEKGLSVKLVGKIFFDWGPLPENASYEPERWDIEVLTKKCAETAGIMYGRTTIEGWMCGKPGHFWEVDENGNLSSYNYLQPHNVDLKKHDSKEVAKKLLSFV